MIQSRELQPSAPRPQRRNAPAGNALGRPRGRLRELDGFDAQEAALRPANDGGGGLGDLGGDLAGEDLLGGAALAGPAPAAQPGSALGRAVDAGRVEVGEPDDALERQADQVAAAALATPEAKPGAASAKAEARCDGCGAPRVGRGADAECASCGKKAGASSHHPSGSGGSAGAGPLRRKPVGGGPAPAATALPVPGAGQPLSERVRGRVEPVLGMDLSGVRVHSGPTAQRDADAVQAKAFAHGGHIWLGAGQSAEDVGLMAHEAAHVAQQSGGGAVQAKPAVQRDLLDEVVPDWVMGLVRSAQGAIASGPIQIRQNTASVAGEAKGKAAGVASEASAGVASAKEAASSQALQLGADGKAQTTAAAAAAKTAATQGDAQAGAIRGQLAGADDVLDPGRAAANEVPDLSGGGGPIQAGVLTDVGAPPKAPKASAEGPAPPAPASPGAQAPAPTPAAPAQGDVGPAPAPEPGAAEPAPAAAPMPAAPAAEVKGPTPVEVAAPDAGAAHQDNDAKLKEGRAGAKGAHPAKGWDCSEKQIISKISAVQTSVLDGLVTQVCKTKAGANLVNFVTTVAAGIKGAAKSLKKGVGDAVAGVKGFVSKSFSGVSAAAKKAVTAAKIGAGLIKEQISNRWSDLKSRAAAGWDELKRGASKRITGFAKKVKGRAAGIVAKANGAAQAFWKWLGPVGRGIAKGVAAPFAAPLAAAAKGAEAVGAVVSKQKERFLAVGKAAMDSTTKMAALAWDGVKLASSATVTGAKALAQGTVNNAKAAGGAVATAVENKAGVKVSDLKKAGAEKLAQAKGAACEATGDLAGPCVEKLLPPPEGGPGSTTFTSLTGKGNLGVVIEGVPVDVAAGYGMKITRSAKSYTMVITGEATAQVKAAMAKKGGKWGSPDAAEKGGSIGISGSLPSKAMAIMNLNGAHAPIPAIPFGAEKKAEAGADAKPASGTAPSGGPAPASGAAPAGADAKKEAEAPVTAAASAGGGVKRQVALTYTFDASKDKTSCDGLGGLTAFLAGQGMAMALPAPFSALASGVSAGAFADRLTSAKFTGSEIGGASVDLKAGEAATVQLAAAGENAVAVEMKKITVAGKAGKHGSAEDAKGEHTERVIAASLSTSLSGKAGLAVAAGSVPLFGAAAGVTGGVSLGVDYNLDTEVLSASYETTAGASVDLTSFTSLIHLLPAAAAGAKARAQALVDGGQSGQVGVEAKYSVAASDLQTLVADLDRYFANPAAVNAAGVWERVARYVDKSVKTTGTLTVKATTTDKLLGANAGYNDGKGTGGGVQVEWAKGKEIVLYTGPL